MSNSTPEIDAVLNDPASSYWLKTTLTSALERDPIDASCDAQALHELLNDRAITLLAQAEDQLR